MTLYDTVCHLRVVSTGQVLLSVAGQPLQKHVLSDGTACAWEPWLHVFPKDSLREAFKKKKRSNLGIVPNRVGGSPPRSQFLNRF